MPETPINKPYYVVSKDGNGTTVWFGLHEDKKAGHVPDGFRVMALSTNGDKVRVGVYQLAFPFETKAPAGYDQDLYIKDDYLQPLLPVVLPPNPPAPQPVPPSKFLAAVEAGVVAFVKEFIRVYGL